MSLLDPRALPVPQRVRDNPRSWGGEVRAFRPVDIWTKGKVQSQVLAPEIKIQIFRSLLRFFRQQKGPWEPSLGDQLQIKTENYHMSNALSFQASPFHCQAFLVLLFNV